MHNKFLEIVSSPLMNLDHTYRYSGTKLVESESLSQHIIDTVMMGLKIIDEANQRAGMEVLNPSNYLMKAICHDLEEVITGDIPRPLKYYDKDTTASMKHVADQVAYKFFGDQFYQGDAYYNVWRDAKDGDEGYILKLVDTLVVVNKVLKEVSLLHNYYMLRGAHEVSQYLVELLDHFDEYCKIDNFDIRIYLENLVRDALHCMDKVLKDNESTMKNFNIHSQSMI